MKEIVCTKGFVAFVDDEDFERLSQFRWSARLHNANRGPKAHHRPIRCARVDGKWKQIYLYHDILPMRAGFVIDHINGDPFDNRRCNLRYATRGENVRNQRRAKQSATGYKGVCKRRRRFFAHIVINYQDIWTSGFPTAELAALAYDKLALQHHGRFASLNFPELAKEAA